MELRKHVAYVLLGGAQSNMELRVIGALSKLELGAHGAQKACYLALSRWCSERPGAQSDWSSKEVGTQG